MIINELPFEILSFIFKFIPIRETLKLRVVCKKFKSIVDDLKYETLKIAENYDNRYSEKYKSTSDYDLIIIKDDDQFLLNISALKFRRIKKLETYLNGSILLKSSLFDLFYELEELSIELIIDVNRINLNLNKLKKLKFFYQQPHLLNLNTPNLSELNIINLNGIKFKHPKKITKLKISSLETDDLTNFNQLINLQFLIILEDKNQLINNDLLKNLTKLKELHITTISFHDHHLLNQLTFKRTNLSIFLKGIRLNHFKMIPIDGVRNRSFDIKGKLLEFLIKNNNLIDYKIDCSLFICYFNELENLIHKNNQLANQQQKESNVSNQDEKLSNDNQQQEKSEELIDKIELLKFLDKFNKLETTYIDNEVNNENNLLEFIRKSKSKILEINKKCKSLSLSFFNQLSNITTINELSINENKNLKSDQDYEFLFKIPNLRNISIQQSISIDILIRLIEKMLSINCLINVDNQQNVIYFQYDLLNYQSSFRTFDEFYDNENYKPKLSLTINYQPNLSNNNYNNNNQALRGLIDNELFMLNNQFNRLDNRVNQLNHHFNQLNEFRLNRIIEEPINLINNIFNNRNDDDENDDASNSNSSRSSTISSSSSSSISSPSSSSSSSSSSNSNLFGQIIDASDDDIQIIHENIPENQNEMNDDNDVEIIFDNHNENHHNNPIRERRMRFNFDDDYFEDDFFSSDSSDSSFSDNESVGYYKVINFYKKTELIDFLNKLKTEFKLDKESNLKDKFNINELRLFLQKFNNSNRRWRI